MKVTDIITESNYDQEFEKFKPYIQFGQEILNATEIDSGVDWKGKDDLYIKAQDLGGRLTRLGQGTKSIKDATQKANVSSNEFQEILALVKTAKKAEVPDPETNDEVDDEF